MRDLCLSPLWDPDLSWNSENPRLTPCFRNVIFPFILITQLVLTGLLEALYVLKLPGRNLIPWNGFNSTKIILLGPHLTIMVMRTLLSLISNMDLASCLGPFIKFLTLLFCGSLIVVHRRNGLRSSASLFFFWLTWVAIQVLDMYSQAQDFKFNDGAYQAEYLLMAICESLLVVIQFILHIFPDEHPPGTEKLYREDCSIISFLSYSWFTSSIKLGYNKPLTSKDLGELVEDLKTEYIYPNFNDVWRRAKRLGGRNATTVNQNHVRLLPVLIRCYWKRFVAGSIIRLFFELLAFVNPMVLRLILRLLEGGEPKWHGYVYAVALFITNQSSTVLGTTYFYYLVNLGITIKSALTAAIYRKALRIGNEEKNQFTTGEIVNLMAVDATKFQHLTPVLHFLWSGPLRIGVATYLLWNIIGVSVFSGLLVMVLLIPITSLIFNKSHAIQMQQMKYKDGRLKSMNELLSGIKVLKLYAWESPFSEKINKIRAQELKYLKISKYLNIFTSFISAMAPYLVALATFSTFVLSDPSHILTSEVAFVSLSLFNVIRLPLSQLPNVVSKVTQASVSLKRIERFLNAKEIDQNAVQDIGENSNVSVAVKDGAFSWSENDVPVLQNINLEVRDGTLVGVVGPVGSGKSSLLQALLGEMHVLLGRLHIKPSVFYTSQQAWTQHCTLRDNIVFGQPYVEYKYNKVLEAAALVPDCNTFGRGDLTEIGEKGINLSGGQKQRVCLARAVYFDADVYLLDDPLSAVDAHVGQHLFDNIIGPKGMLCGKTRLLVTNAVHVLPRCDVIVVMKEGRVMELGTYNDLMSGDSEFQRFMLEHLKGSQQQVEPGVSAGVASEILTSPDHTRKRRSGDNISGVQCKVGNESEEKTVSEEKIETGKVKSGVFMLYLKSLGAALSITLIVSNVLVQVFAIGTGVWLSEWSQDTLHSSTSFDQTVYRLSIYGVLGLGQAFFTIFGTIVLALGTIRSARNIHSSLLGRILHAPMTFFDSTPSGRILNRFAKDLEMVDQTLPENIEDGLRTLAMTIGVFAVISVTTPLFLLVGIPIFVLYYFILKFYIPSSRQLKRLESASRSPIYSHFTESLTGRVIINGCRQTPRFIRTTEMKIDDNTYYFYFINVANRWLAFRLQSLGSVIIFTTSLLSVLGRGVSSGMAGLAITYSLNITVVLNFLVKIASDIESNIVSVERLKEYMEVPQEPASELPSDNELTSWPNRGDIRFSNYSAKYRKGSDLVLEAINCDIRAGERIGIVGRTGAGKSSVASSLFRAIETDSGAIYIDDVDISTVGLELLRSKLTIIPQDPVLFSGTLRYNIDPFEKHTDSDIMDALEHAHLLNFVCCFPEGLDHEISEEGINISVGQRQLICLARAMLRNSKVILLDEATASIDLETDSLIQETIKTTFQHCTVLIIAHRIHTVMDVDRILVLDAGKVVEFDHPDDLIRNTGSMFSSLVVQSGLS